MVKEKNTKEVIALAKVKLLLKEYYAKLGKEELIEGSDWEEETKDLLYQIDTIVQEVKIPAKVLIAVDLENSNSKNEGGEKNV